MASLFAFDENGVDAGQSFGLLEYTGGSNVWSTVDSVECVDRSGWSDICQKYSSGRAGEIALVNFLSRMVRKNDSNG